MLWRGGRYSGVVASLIVGFGLWAYTLLMPALLTAYGVDLDIIRHGPFGLAWLRPESLFGISGIDPLTHGVFWSLSLNVATFVGVSLLRSPGLRERLQAAKFLEDAIDHEAPERGLPRSSATVADLRELVERFIGPELAHSAFAEYHVARRKRPHSQQRSRQFRSCTLR